MERVTPQIQIRHDRVPAPVAVPVDDVAPIAAGQQFRVESVVVRPRLRVRTDADLVRGGVVGVGVGHGAQKNTYSRWATRKPCPLSRFRQVTPSERLTQAMWPFANRCPYGNCLAPEATASSLAQTNSAAALRSIVEPQLPLPWHRLEVVR